MEGFNADGAALARDEGMQRAAMRAGIDWFESAVSDFSRFVSDRGEATFEQWRMDWIRRGMPQPASHKAWGSVAGWASRRGLVVNTGRYVKAKSIKTHAHPVPLWAPAQITKGES